MAVSPALTFPARRIRRILEADTAKTWINFDAKKLAQLNRAALAATVHFLAPLPIYRSDAAAQLQLPEAVQRRRVILIQKSVFYARFQKVNFRGFPVPYFPRGTTRPERGETWPRFAVYGSTV